MPANIGEMFYYGEIPWHREGMALARPATLEEALRAGELDWKVGDVDLQTCDDPPSPVPKRKAIVRLDRSAGHEGRVLGVAHRGFRPLQNRDGALLFDAIFGQGKAVYHTGGYLGHGEVVWLLAKIDKPMDIGNGDLIEPYALFANSHDGSRAISISLTTGSGGLPKHPEHRPEGSEIGRTLPPGAPGIVPRPRRRRASLLGIHSSGTGPSDPSLYRPLEKSLQPWLEE